MSKSVQYHSYIVRAWSDQPTSEGEWSIYRFSLEDPSTRLRCGFSDFNALVDFFRRELNLSELEERPN